MRRSDDDRKCARVYGRYVDEQQYAGGYSSSHDGTCDRWYYLRQHNNDNLYNNSRLYGDP
jgi:hypothetical protein